jgi:hypothetical protein
MAQNWKFYIENDDFEGAFERFTNATKNWKNHWFDVCAQIMENCKEWAKKYILDPVAKTIEVKIKVPRTRKTYDIDTQNINLLDDAKEKCYLFRFFDADGNRLCSKVGTTQRTVLKRLKEELSSKTYIGMGAVRAVIDRVYDCGEMPAEGLESRLRAEYIQKYPGAFKKNDRFIFADFDLEECDKIAKKYLAGA